MGIVQKQSIKGTIWSYLGVVLGFVNMAVLSPRILTSGEIGVLSVLVAFATIMAQFSSLGFTNVINRLFPYFRNIKEKHNGFIALALTITLAGFILGLIFLKFYTPHFEEANIERSSLITRYSFYLPALLIITLLFNLLDNYNKVLYDAVLGTFLREVLFRLLHLMIIGLYYFKVIDFDNFVFGYVLCLGIPMIIMVIKLVKRGEISLRLKLNFITPELRREIIFLSLLGILTGLSAFVLTTLDKLFINKYLGESQVGIYTIASYFAVLIMLPGKSISKISVPFLAESWKKDDLKTIDDIYIRSSINQYAMGLLLVIGIIVNMDNIFRILPDEYRVTADVIILLSLGNLVNVSSGISGTIIGTSSLYRYQTWLMTVLIVVFVILSFILIPRFGLTGAAIAGMLSNVIYNTLGVIVIGRKYNLWPYKTEHLKMTLVGVIALVAGFLLPQSGLITDLIVRSIIVSVIFVAGLYFWKLSDDMNRIVNSLLDHIKKYLS